jgi:hypothetical protein
MSTFDDLERFYSILARIADTPGQGRPLRELPSRSLLPERGVYFFLELGEHRSAEPKVSRVVRVGTHAVSCGSKSNLCGRLKAHLGTRSGGGNHRGSIFQPPCGGRLAGSGRNNIDDMGCGNVRNSGLWNLNHVKEVYDPRFLDTLESSVTLTCIGKPRRGSRLC